MLAGLEHRHPGTMVRIIRFRDGVRRSISPAEPAKMLSTCRICGDLTSGEVCQVCRLLRADGE
jgi:hypothetical protein